ncbi:hypothetical protein EDF46_0859 [Frondihabitans sp. PhB188]|uniref:hypothetical protein n=1 Tax=Frondihabitans sp. PhB188 TaxID=2485200 RepID=UPI000F943F23|nr:hypothetical protein [Frondihabitans sp. PhB188]ROQ41479.1 hypothetical protein EDF46_0859 [Frondihabitans sp. PhB188]
MTLLARLALSSIAVVSLVAASLAFGLGAGLCVVSAGIFCVVAGAIITAATVAITGNGAIRCGTKSLRVYPFASHKPRCA